MTDLHTAPADPRRPLLAVLALAALLTGCSEVPDYANPVSWYHGVADVFSGDKPEKTVEAPPPDSADQPFPKLGSVPEAPTAPTVDELASVREGLIADRKNARYTDDTIRREVAAEAPPPSPPQPAPQPVPQVAAQPVPQPAPQPTPQPTPQVIAQVAAQPTPQPAPQVTAQVVAQLAPQPAPVAVQPVPQPAPQPAPQVTAQVATQPTPQPAPVAAQPVPQPASKGPVDVRDLFTSLFSASGPKAVAPRPVQVATAAPPGAVVPGAAPVLSRPAIATPAGAPAGGGASGAVAAIPAGKVAEIHFANGSAALTRAARKSLREVVQRYRQRGGGRVRVVGHASMRTHEMPLDRHEMVNFEMSLKRAKAVADRLLRLGVAPADIALEAHSDKDPIYWEWMPSGEAGNRRVEVFLE